MRLTGRDVRTFGTRLRNRVNSLYALLGISALLPAAVLVGISTTISLHQQQDLLNERLLTQVRDVLDDVDTELRNQTELVKLIADLPLLDIPENFGQLSEWVERAQRSQPRWIAVNVYDADQHLLWSLDDWKSKPSDPDSLRAAIDTKTATIGSIMQGPLGRWGVAVRAPMIRDGKAVGVISLIIGVDRMFQILQQNKIPAGWSAVIADRQGDIIARFPKPATGKRLAKQGMEARQHDVRGVYAGRTLEGRQTMAAFQRSIATGWSVHVSMPVQVYEQPMRKFRWIIATIVVVALSLTGFFIWVLLHYIKRQQQQRERLDQKQRLEGIGQLTGQVAHDFNNLLAVVQANLDVLDHKQLEPTTRDALDDIRTAANTGTRITHDLLSFSRAGSTTVTEINVNERLHNAVNSTQRALPDNIFVRFGLEPRLPKIRVDPVQFDIAILNMLNNSADAMPEGGSIELATYFDDHGREEVVVSVTDTGSGIPPHILPNVFEPFFTTKPPGKGTGFGLSQVYGMVTNAAGSIDIQSDNGGTTIIIRFPAVVD